MLTDFSCCAVNHFLCQNEVIVLPKAGHFPDTKQLSKGTRLSREPWCQASRWPLCTNSTLSSTLLRYGLPLFVAKRWLCARLPVSAALLSSLLACRACSSLLFLSNCWKYLWWCELHCPERKENGEIVEHKDSATEKHKLWVDFRVNEDRCVQIRGLPSSASQILNSM